MILLFQLLAQGILLLSELLSHFAVFLPFFLFLSYSLKGMVAVMLPGTVFTLGIKNYPPARAMVDEGCAVALASDFNPGSSPIMSMPLIMAIACTQLRLTPAESLVAATLNAAWALGRQHEVGSLAPGKMADFVILDGDDYRLVPYRAGHNPVASVFLGGRKIIA